MERSRNRGERHWEGWVGMWSREKDDSSLHNYPEDELLNIK